MCLFVSQGVFCFMISHHGGLSREDDKQFSGWIVYDVDDITSVLERLKEKGGLHKLTLGRIRAMKVYHQSTLDCIEPHLDLHIACLCALISTRDCRLSELDVCPQLLLVLVLGRGTQAEPSRGWVKPIRYHGKITGLVGTMPLLVLLWSSNLT